MFWLHFTIIEQLDDERSLLTMWCFDNPMLPACRTNISLFRLFQTNYRDLRANIKILNVYVHEFEWKETLNDYAIKSLYDKGMRRA